MKTTVQRLMKLERKLDKMHRKVQDMIHREVLVALECATLAPQEPTVQKQEPTVQKQPARKKPTVKDLTLSGDVKAEVTAKAAFFRSQGIELTREFVERVLPPDVNTGDLGNGFYLSADEVARLRACFASFDE